MGYANDRWMNDPAARKEARGEFSSPPQGGMSDPKETIVDTTVMLVRFGGKEFEPVGLAKKRPTLHGGHGLFGSARYGGWWMAFAEYKKIEDFAARRHLPVNVAVRHLCFVPREWSDLGTIVQGKLATPLRAWTGVGNAVTGIDSKGQPRSYAARTVVDEQVVQLFIPGLSNGDLNHDVFQLKHAGFLPTAAD